MPEERNQDRMTRDERILAAVERCSKVRACVLMGFEVEDGFVRLKLLYLEQRDETGRLLRPAATTLLRFPVSYGRSLARVL